MHGLDSEPKIVVFVFLMVTKKMKKDHNNYVSAATCIVWV